MIVVTSGTRNERKYAPTVTKTMIYKPVIEAEPKDEMLLAKSSTDYFNSINQPEIDTILKHRIVRIIT